MTLHTIPPHNFSTKQLIFVKNVPQHSASSIASLFTQYKPLEIKNLYGASRITTLMIALPTADVAALALRRTDGMKVDSTVISVERYNAKQSTVARRKTRRQRRNESGDGYEADGWGEEGEELDDEAPESWEDKEEGSNNDEPVFFIAGRKPMMSEGVSWADVTRGVRETPSPCSAATAPLTPVLTPHLPAPSRVGAQVPPEILVTPPSVISTPLLQSQCSLSPLASEELHPASLETEQTNGNASERVDGNSNQAIAMQAADTAPQQHEYMLWPADSTAYMRSRHCAGCAFCKKRIQGR